MPISAWIMLIIGCLVLYGGLAVCIGIAVRSSRQKEGKKVGR